VGSLLDKWFRRERVPVKLYSRPACPLCELMKDEIARARPAVAYELVEVNIDSDPVLVERFGRSIPVLEIAGRIAFKTRLTAADFERKLERIATAPRGEERG
jgi:glutaredoxin